MLPAINLDEGGPIPLDVYDPRFRVLYVRWERHPEEGWVLFDSRGRQHTVVPISLLHALSEPARTVWPAPAVLPFTDKLVDVFDLDDQGRLYHPATGNPHALCFTGDVFALAAAVAAARG